jgi:hypothetical protein
MNIVLIPAIRSKMDTRIRNIGGDPNSFPSDHEVYGAHRRKRRPAVAGSARECELDQIPFPGAWSRETLVKEWN